MALSTQKQKPTQLERIYRSISSLYLIASLEPIQHFYFAPWARTTPYQVVISSLSKDKETKSHNALVENLCLTNTTTIYTDASLTEKGKGIGVGLVAYNYFNWEKTIVY